MKPALFIFLSLFHFVLTPVAQAGAVSAGGRQAPPSVECLFLDPARPYEPHNFMIYSLNPILNSAGLSQVDLRTKKSSAEHHSFEDLGRTATSGGVVYTGGSERTKAALRVELDKRTSLTHAQFIAEFEHLARLSGVSFVEDAIGYRSTLSFGGQKLSGICAEGPFFYYMLPRR